MRAYTSSLDDLFEQQFSPAWMKKKLAISTRTHAWVLHVHAYTISIYIYIGTVRRAMLKNNIPLTQSYEQRQRNRYSEWNQNRNTEKKTIFINKSSFPWNNVYTNNNEFDYLWCRSIPESYFVKWRSVRKIMQRIETESERQIWPDKKQKRLHHKFGSFKCLWGASGIIVVCALPFSLSADGMEVIRFVCVRVCIIRYVQYDAM